MLSDRGVIIGQSVWHVPVRAVEPSDKSGFGTPVTAFCGYSGGVYTATFAQGRPACERCRWAMIRLGISFDQPAAGSEGSEK